MSSNRDHLIETTSELLEMQGYHATGLNQIIKQSGTPKGSLYHYFPNGKDELTAEALNRTGKIILERIQLSLAEVDDAAEAVRGFILKLAYYVPASGYRAGGPITTVALETAATNAYLSGECKTIYASWQLAFAEKLRANGYPDQRAERVSYLIIASIEGAIILSRTSRSPQPLEAIAEELYLLIQQKP